MTLKDFVEALSVRATQLNDSHLVSQLKTILTNADNPYAEVLDYLFITNDCTFSSEDPTIIGKFLLKQDDRHQHPLIKN